MLGFNTKKDKNTEFTTANYPVGTLTHMQMKHLHFSDDNVRKHDDEKGLDTLKTSILANGLLANLIVVRKGERTFEVVDGQRRLAALRDLEGEGKIQNTYAVPVIVHDKDYATAVSLAANYVRKDMHEVDTYKAFAALIKQGKSYDDIASEYSLTTAAVKRVVRLGRVAPELLELYHQGKINSNTIQTLAIVDDKEKQVEAYEAASNSETYFSPNDLRKILIGGNMDCSHRVIKFIGLDTYTEAGGPIQSDLFSDDEHAAYILDEPLALTLANNKLDEIAANYKNKGWSNVSVSIDYDYDFMNDRKWLSSEDPVYSRDERARMDELKNIIDALDQKTAGDPDYEATDEEVELYSNAEDELYTLEEKEGEYDPKKIKTADLHISLNHDGSLNLRGGIPKKTGKSDVQREDHTSDTSNALPKTLKEHFESRRSEIMRLELSRSFDITLRLVVTRLIEDHLHKHSELRIGLTFNRHATAEDLDKEKPLQKMINVNLDACLGVIEKKSDIFDQVMMLQIKDVKNLFAVLASQYFTSYSDNNGQSDLYFKTLLKLLEVDCLKYWRPTKTNCFGKMKKPTLIDLILDSNPDHSRKELLKLKKGELADLAAKECPSYIPEIMDPRGAN